MNKSEGNATFDAGAGCRCGHMPLPWFTVEGNRESEV